MYYYSLFCLGLFVLSVGSTDVPLLSAKEIYAAKPLAATPGLSNCATTVLLLTANATSCLSLIDASTGQVQATSCPAVVLGSTGLVCLSSYCHLFNPINSSISTFNYPSTGYPPIVIPSVIRTISFAPYQPLMYTFVQRGNSITDAVFVMGSSHSTIVMMTYSPYNGYPSTLPTTFYTVVQLSNTNPVVGLVAVANNVNTTNIMLTFESGTTVYNYNAITGELIGTFGTFGRTGMLSLDGSGRLFVNDLDCQCIQIFDPAGNLNSIVTNVTALSSIAPSRDATILITNGIDKVVNDNFTITGLTVTNATCPNTGGSATVSIRGGSYYYTYDILPDLRYPNGTVYTVVSSAMNNTFYRLFPRNPLAAPFYLYNESAGGNVVISAGWQNSVLNLQVNSSTITAYEGEFCMGATLGSGGSISFGGQNGPFIDSSEFAAVELMVNVGDGGQNFSIGIYPITKIIAPGDLPLNSWNKITLYIDTIATTSVTVNYISGTSNPIYFDNVVMVPHSNSTRIIRVVDYCSQKSLYSPSFSVSGEDIMKISVSKSITSCAPDGVNGQKASDAYISLNVTGGIAPYSYHWTFSNATTSIVTDLSQMSGNVIIYDNNVVAPFLDVSSSSGRILQDNTLYHSSPYSFSMTPAANNEGMIFNSPTAYDGSKYSAVSFWVHGGVTGGQLLIVQLKMGYLNVGPSFYIHKLVGLSVFPGNEWIKVLFPIPAIPFTGIYILGGGAIAVQPRVWIDDVQLVVKTPSVIVTDNSGCAINTTALDIYTPTAITTTTTISNAKCYGFADGSVDVNVEGGTLPYAYSWFNATSNSSLDRLSESIQLLNITDYNGCIPTGKTVVANVLQPPKLHLQTIITAPMCYGGQGTIQATAFGGSGTYTYTWLASGGVPFSSPPSPQPTILFADAFAGGAGGVGPVEAVCLGTGSQLVLSFSPSHSGYCSLKAAPPAGTSSVFGIRCNDCFDFSKNSQLQFWVLFQQPQDITGLTLVFSKGNNTIWSSPLANYIINSTTAVDWQQVIINNVTTTICDTFSITSSASSMSSFYVDDMILIPVASLIEGNNVNVGYSSLVSGPASDYTAYITDSNSCPLITSVSITQPIEITATPTTTSPTGNDKNDGSISLAVTGGSPPYQFHWLDMNTTTSSPNRAAGNGSFVVLITDAIGCSVTQTVIVGKPVSSSKSNVGPVIGGVVGGVVGAICIVAALLLFNQRRHRRQMVQALIDVEEGERRNYKIDFSNLEVLSIIGAGSFGEVFKGEYKGTDVAIKRIKAQTQMTKQQIDEFARESAVMVGLRHPNIILFMGVCVEPSKLCIVTELMPRGNLLEVLRDEDIRLPDQIIFKMALETLKGLQFIHSSGLIHRDLKSPNLLIDKDWNIKIADFGLSCARHSANSDAQVSLLWTAPEILMREPECYSFASDMFSFGVIMWELVSKTLPWDGTTAAAITSKVVAGQRPPINPDWNSSVVKLIESSWAQDPLIRPSVKQARTILETEVIPVYGELNVGSTSDYSSLHGERKSNTIRAPPPQPPFALVVARVSNATELWEEDPRGMAKGMQATWEILHHHCNMMSGYEVSQEGAGTFAFVNPVNAINFCLQVQTDLRAYSWPERLLACEHAEEVSSSKEGVFLQRGLRVRMGVHFCSPTMRKDPINGRATYAGTSMLVGAAVAKCTPAGTILVDQEMYNRFLSASSVLPFAINPIGPVKLEDQTLNLFQVVPAAQKDLLDGVSTLTDDGSADLTDTWLVDFNEVKIHSLIGAGNFGEVWSATYGDIKVAAKKFTKQRVTGNFLLEVRSECAVLRSLKHPNIVKFVGMCLNPENLCLLTELMERGALSSVLYGTTELSWSRRLSFARDIAEGMAYLHTNQVIHRDIKSPNLLVGQDWQIRICDFGFSRIKAANQTMTQCGTVSWTAPEIFDGAHYSEKADVYSFGIVLWEIIFRQKPWEGKHSMKIIQSVELGVRPSVANMPADAPVVLKTLMVSCWDQSPTSRPSFAEIAEQLAEPTRSGN